MVDIDLEKEDVYKNAIDFYNDKIKELEELIQEKIWKKQINWNIKYQEQHFGKFVLIL